MSRMLVGVSRGKHEGDLVRIRENLLAYKTTSESEVSDAVAEVVKRIQIEIAPIQDKHGYTNPWVGGAGKNLAHATLTEIKARNTDGTWTGNKYVNNGVTFTVEADDAGNVSTISTSGTASGNATLMSHKLDLVNGTEYTMSGSPSGGSSSKYELMLASAFEGTATAKKHLYQNETNYTCDETKTYGLQVVIRSGQDATGLEFKPMMRLATVTDGTYEPWANVCFIYGHDSENVVRTGKNLFDKTITIHEQKIRQDDGTEIANTASNYTDPISGILPSTKYTISGTLDTSSTGVRIYYLDQYKNWISRSAVFTSTPYTFTTPANCKFVEIQYIRASGDLNTVCIEKGETATTYEPYKGESVSVSFPSTVYGGTLELYQDGSGKVTVDFSKYALPLTGWTLGTNGFYLAMPSDCISQNTKAAQSDGKCTHFALVKDISPGDFIALDNVVCYCNGSITDNKRLYVRASQFADASAFETYLSAQNTAGTPVEMTYVLATPVITYLSASEVITLLSGYNTLYASTGSIQSIIYPVERYADAVETDERFDADEAELSDAQDDIVELAETKAPVIVEEVTTPASVMSFSDGADNLPMKVVFGIEPVQDLHGYENPWPTGGGKNLLPIQTIDGSNNDISVVGNATFTKITDPAGNVVGVNINASEAVTSNTYCFVSRITLPVGSYKIRCFGGVDESYYVRIGKGGTGNSGAPGTYVAYVYAEEVTLNVAEQSNYSFAVAIANGKTASNVKLKIMVSTETITDFAPYSNICPITGFTWAELTRTGKNLIEGYIPNANVDSNNKITGNDSSNDVAYAKITKGMTYTVSKITASQAVYQYTTDEPAVGVSFVGSRIIVANVHGFTFTAPVDGYVVVRDTLNARSMMCEIGQTATETFEPFTGNDTYTYPFSTTVYGGTLTVNKDGSGTLVVDRIFYEFDGSNDENWSIRTGTYNYFSIDTDKSCVNTDDDTKKISNSYEWLSSLSNSDTNIGIRIVNNTTFRFRYEVNNDLTVSDLKTYLASNPLQIVVSLVSPLSPISITAEQVKTLLGVNNVWADTGNVLRIEYSADTKMYIDNLGQTEEDYIANANIASGDYFQVGNTLYIATSAIASGERIIPGTNCSQTTIADVLNADATGMSFGG